MVLYVIHRLKRAIFFNVRKSCFWSVSSFNENIVTTLYTYNQRPTVPVYNRTANCYLGQITYRAGYKVCRAYYCEMYIADLSRWYGRKKKHLNCNHYSHLRKTYNRSLKYVKTFVNELLQMEKKNFSYYVRYGRHIGSIDLGSGYEYLKMYSI